MTPKERNEDFPVIFSQLINNLGLWYTRNISNRRKQYAPENTYSSKINHIISVI